MFCDFRLFSVDILTGPLQIGTHNMGFSAQFPAKKGPGNLTPNGRRTEQVKTGQVNLDHLTGHSRGHFRGRLRGTFRGSP